MHFKGLIFIERLGLSYIDTNIVEMKIDKPNMPFYLHICFDIA